MTTWHDVLAQEKEKEYFKQVRAFVAQRRQQSVVFPAVDHVFAALKLTEYDDVKVVILGQDPYHGPKQAHGLSFSVQDGVSFPPSLQNIFKELNQDLNLPMPTSGNLTNWAKQGVLLLNTVLTVEQGKANSHQNRGWETFTDRVIEVLNEREKPVIFVLWGRPAQKKTALINQKHHKVIMAPHPSPLSAHRGFFGSKPFSQINQQLIEWGDSEIDWQLK
ncbi:MULTISPECIES: uracil-DNA glycosylase [unclassified Granulicatella]|uniref:uracil-DNA glycosylase n=1 Tax=unclassified Granulicatella TaxID=2630493 RepID=UPI00107472F2|nr:MULTISPECIES: uracil-DNA glycosylase [unclassified Granulicatella]MBF0781019.1 uracil-DNA glycosylase [Granulicatella sp. 19428wC4_WM01]TFU92574.1 uracil-DNA glycosylase [Granulicatella sp. WM01]